jgi:nucleoside-diphosphate-sugar epimerase
MKVLLTGGAGYLGSVLIPKLIARGHSLRILDVGYFGVGHLRPFQQSFELIREDIRQVSDKAFRAKVFDGIDCVIHLAALSNDPSADLDPELTEEVNARTTRLLAEAAKERKAKFIFSSSCSIYGAAGDGETDEDGHQEPQTTYAVSKVKAEKALLELVDSSWRPVILRNGTMYGYSPRMRFDVVVNIFSLYSALYNEIKVFGNGMQWRPFVHVSDCARAFVFFAEKPSCSQMCYNIGHENLRVVDIRDIFVKMNPRLKVVNVKLEKEDLRDYRVSTARMRREGFETRVSVPVGAEELVDSIITGAIPDPESIFYSNAKWMKELGRLGAKDPRAAGHLTERMRATPPA